MTTDSRLIAALAAALLLLSTHTTVVAEERGHQTADGLTIYLGILPAEMILTRYQGQIEQVLHTGDLNRLHAYHLTAAVYDSRTAKPLRDAQVEARIALLGSAGVVRPLFPMAIADTVSYGNFFPLRRDGRYRITISVTRADTSQPVVLDFYYQHHKS